MDRYLPDNTSPTAPVEAPPALRVHFRALGSLDLSGAGGEVRALLVQPKRLALFAYLVLASPPRLHRRDSLLALFWPESSAEQARRSLRQALHFLRRALGSDVIVTRGDEEVGVDSSAVWCDVREFERALDAGQYHHALTLYRGHLLDGFHTSGVSAELERWLEIERSRVRGRAVRAALALADAAENEHNPTLAAQFLRDLLRLDHDAEPALRRLMSLLDRAGDSRGALRSYDEFVRQLTTETAVSRETRELAERIRVGRTPAVGARATEARSPHTAPEAVAPITRVDTSDMDVADDVGAAVSPFVPSDRAPVTSPGASRRPRTRWRRRWLVSGAVLLGTLAVAAVAQILGRSVDETTSMVLAVGAVDDRTGVDSLGTARVLRDLLATNLARVPGLTMVSQTRIQELLARIGAGRETRSELTRVARMAGAAEVLEGELYRRSPDALRLDLRRVDAATGVIRRSYSAEGADVFALVERLSEQLAAELGQPSPTPSLAALTTTSLVARRFYEEGVREYYAGELDRALHLFQTALTEDSTFAMAAYFASRIETAGFGHYGYVAQAVRMSRRATERERLLIASRWAEMTSNPAFVALAESLSTRFPLEPEADLALGRAQWYSGDFDRAVRSFRRAADRDTLGPRPAGSGAHGRQPPCTACEALGYLVSTYNAIDSVAAAERTAREWIRLQPHSLHAWAGLASVFRLQGRAADAADAWRTRRTLQPGNSPDDAIQRAITAITFGDFAEADRLLAERARSAGGAVRAETMWWQVVSYRTQGRLAAALEVAQRRRAAVDTVEVNAAAPEAQVLFELGRVREAARAFEGITEGFRPPIVGGSPDPALGITARHVAWWLTHTATAYAAAGDTARVARLADSLAVLGPLSGYGRDRKLHHHVRGLLLLARGRHEDAAASFRRAIHSPTLGFTRTNLELGRLLTALGQPDQAVTVLGPALRGGLDGSNYYVTHAELHEALAEAYDAAGQRDSARAHYRWVANAWQSADPPFRARAARARERAGP